MKQNRKVIVALVAVLVLIAVVAGIFFATRSDTQQGAKAYTVDVTHADGSTKTFSYRTDEEYLGAALLSEGLIAGDDSEWGLYVTTVDGEQAVYEDNGAYWAFYIGDEYASTGVDSTPVTDGGSYALVYTIG